MLNAEFCNSKYNMVNDKYLYLKKFSIQHSALKNLAFTF